MRVLLTGGAGYVGSHVAVELLQDKYDVVIVDDLSNSNLSVIDNISAAAGRKPTFVKADVTSRSSVANVLKSFAPFDAVMHFAGHKSVAESGVQPLKYYINNLTSATSVLAAMAEYSVKRFVFSSSATVYEESTARPIGESSQFGLNQANAYGRTKAIIERMLEDVAAADPELQVSMLRYFNPVGAHPSGHIGEDPRGTPNNLLPLVAQVAVGRRDHVSVFGDTYETVDGTGVRDYIHVVDLAKGHIAALAKSVVGVHAFNLGTAQGHSVLEVIESYARASGVDIPYVIERPRDGDVATSVADVSKAKRQLGWSAELTLDDACRDDWNWQLHLGAPRPATFSGDRVLVSPIERSRLADNSE